MARAQHNTNGATPLAVTPAGAAGTVTGSERNKLQGLATIQAVNPPLTLSGGALDIQAATSGQEGSMSAAQAQLLAELGGGDFEVLGSDQTLSGITTILTALAPTAGTYLITAHVTVGDGLATPDYAAFIGLSPSYDPLVAGQVRPVAAGALATIALQARAALTAGQAVALRVSASAYGAQTKVKATTSQGGYAGATVLSITRVA